MLRQSHTLLSLDSEVEGDDDSEDQAQPPPMDMNPFRPPQIAPQMATVSLTPTNSYNVNSTLSAKLDMLQVADDEDDDDISDPFPFHAFEASLDDIRNYESPISRYITQSLSKEQYCHFDVMRKTASNGNICLLHSSPLKSGYHEWTIQILRSDGQRLEMGVVGTNQIQYISVHDKGIGKTPAFGM